MTRTLPNPALLAAPPWIERHGPWLVSVLIHLLLFAWLFSSRVEWKKTPEPPKRQVRLVLQPVPTPAPQPTIPPAREIPLPPPARGEEAPPPEPVEVAVVQPVPTPVPTAPPSPVPTFAPDLPATPVPVPTAAPTAEPVPTPDPAQLFLEEQQKRIERIREQYKQMATEQRREVLDARKDIGERLGKLQMLSSAASKFTNYKGARVGAIRTLNLDSAPAEATRKVMDRYHIQVTTGYVDQVKPSPLSSASSGGKTYHPSNQPGYGELFLISVEAQRKMWWLETNYLRTHGFEPESAMVDTVEFGVVRQPDGSWDLGIIRIEVRPVRAVGAPTVDRQ